jgi:hypothetical protein
LPYVFLAPFTGNHKKRIDTLLERKDAENLAAEYVMRAYDVLYLKLMRLIFVAKDPTRN